MNNNISRYTKQLATNCYQVITTENNPSNIKQKLSKLLQKPRPFTIIKISNHALNTCFQNNVLPYDYFILTPKQLTNKYNNFFKSEVISILNPSNQEIIKKILNLDKTKELSIKSILQILNNQSINLIDKKEITKFSEKMEMIELVDLWLTPKEVIQEFFEVTGLNRDECLDPCASDGRWLAGKGYSIDILPMSPEVKQQDFLTLEQLPAGVKTIVGNVPFCFLDNFVEKALELNEDCYFLVSGDTILKHFPNQIEHLYVFSGLEGEQKDNRTRCEFEVPYLIRSALWCCIVHLTRARQPEWIVEQDLSNEERRDGYHIALGKNVFIKSEIPVDENSRITKIKVKGSIQWKGGKKIILDDGEILDLRGFEWLQG